jgi:D-alanyl-lipoteichoic acid acyltransferase DltB (MBOAT superfamily)
MLLFIAAVAITFHLFPGRIQRRFFLSITNVAFLVPLVPNPQSWACLVLFIGGTYGILSFSRTYRWWPLIPIGICTTIAAFVIIKRYSFLEYALPSSIWKHVVEVVGLSYMLFKFIHVLVDQWQGQLAPCSFMSYTTYQLAFFTLLAGPIQRYNDFHRFWEEMDPRPGDIRETLLAWNRILTGMVKMGLFASLASFAFERAGLNFEPQPIAKLLSRFAIYLYSYPLFLYFNFSGYTDVVIGSAGLLGCVLPENFNRPYVARNVHDYWNRWHMSLTFWIRDYIFMASYKACAELFSSWQKLIGYGLIFLSLAFAGVWHGATANFAVFGAIHGLGAGANQAYADALKKMLGRSGIKRYQESRWIRCVAVLLTFNFVCFSLLFFSTGLERTLEILNAVGSQLF